MQVNMDGKEVMIIGFGGVLTTTIIILTSIYVGFGITTNSQPKTITVQSQPAQVSVNIPQQTPPKIEVLAATPTVTVHVPKQETPIVNVSSPPANVTVIKDKEIGQPGEVTVNLPSKIIPANHEVRIGVADPTMEGILLPPPKKGATDK